MGKPAPPAPTTPASRTDFSNSWVANSSYSPHVLVQGRSVATRSATGTRYASAGGHQARASANVHPWALHCTTLVHGFRGTKVRYPERLRIRQFFRFRRAFPISDPLSPGSAGEGGRAASFESWTLAAGQALHGAPPLAPGLGVRRRTLTSPTCRPAGSGPHECTGSGVGQVAAIVSRRRGQSRRIAPEFRQID